MFTWTSPNASSERNNAPREVTMAVNWPDLLDRAKTRLKTKYCRDVVMTHNFNVTSGKRDLKFVAAPIKKKKILFSKTYIIASDTWHDELRRSSYSSKAMRNNEEAWGRTSTRRCKQRAAQPRVNFIAHMCVRCDSAACSSPSSSC